MKIKLMGWKNPTRPLDRRFSLRTRTLAGTIGLLVAILFETGIGMGQQASTATAPIFSANAKYVNGVAPGYWPTPGAGLTLNLSAGSAYCGNPPALVTYAAGTLTMVNAATNLVYLDPAASCAPAVSQAANFSVGQIPIAKVVTAGSVITTIADMRGAGFAPLPCAMSSAGSVGCSALGTNQNITLTPTGTGQISLRPNSGFLTAPSNIQNYFGIFNGAQVGCLNNSFLTCFQAVLQTNDTFGGHTGLYGAIDLNNASGAITGAAVEGDAYNSGLANNNGLAGFYGFVEQDGAGTITYIASVEAGSNAKTAGTVTTNYGLLVDPQTAGSKNYAIYTSGTAPSVFGGNVTANSFDNVKTADFVTSSTTCGLQEQHDALPPTGGTIWFSPRNCTPTTRTFITKSNVHITGPGLAATMTYGGTGVASSGMIVVGNAGAISGFSISNITLDGANIITALEINNCTNCTVNHIVAKNAPPDGTPVGGTGNPPVSVNLSTDVIVRDSFISGGRGDFGDGILFQGCVRCQAVNNHVSDVTRIGIVSESNGTTKSGDILISGNVINNVHDASGGQVNACIWAENTNSAQIVDNRCSNSADIINIVGNGTTATATLASPFTFPNTTVTITGNSQAAFNGTFTITVVNSTTFTFASATNATGTWGVAANAVPNNNGITIGLGSSAPSSFIMHGNTVRDFNNGYIIGPSSTDNVLIEGGSVLKGGVSAYATGVSILGGRTIKIKGMYFGDTQYGGSAGAIVLNGGNNIDFLSIEDCSIGTMTQSLSSADLLLYSMNGFTLSDLSVRGLTGAAAWLYGDSGGTGTYTRFNIANSFLSTTARFGNFKGATFISHDQNGQLNLSAGGTNQKVVISSTGTGHVTGTSFVGGVNIVTSSATMNFDASLGNTQATTLTLNVTAPTLSNCAAGELLVFDIIQDATGSRSFVWPTNVLNAGTIGATASKHNIQTFYCDGTNARATAAMLTNQN